MDIKKLLEELWQHENRFLNGFYFVASENSLSPLARLPFALDAYSRYFFNHMRQSGKWSFQGGRELGAIEQEILFPLLQSLTRAKYVDTRPISGMNCLAIVLGGLANAGDCVLSVPINAGGHFSTAPIANRFGIDLQDLPMMNPYDLDIERLAGLIKAKKPRLIYLDQSNLLFPIDPQPIRELTEEFSPNTRIHFDSSHLNGLILGKAIANPLERGAHSFGGSTHKSLAGPHKAFFATNDPEIWSMYNVMTNNFVSHSHMADVVSLTITLLEIRDCGGERYAKLCIENAKEFGRLMLNSGFDVVAAERGFTACHQIWIASQVKGDFWEMGDRLANCGLIVNSFESMPGTTSPAFRLSLSEVTRLGLQPDEVKQFTDLFQSAFDLNIHVNEVIEKVCMLRRKFPNFQYCFGASGNEIPSSMLDPIIKCLCRINA